MRDATLRELASLGEQPAVLSESTLVLIACQNTYTFGVLELDGVESALNQAAELLDRARREGIPIVHVVHDGGPGSLFDIRSPIGQIVEQMTPRTDEPVVVKYLPSAFTATDLDQRLTSLRRRDLILAGFMTHMCVSSTARAAFDLGYWPTVVAAATATRSLPDSNGDRVPAAAIQTASLAAVSDLFGVVVPTADAILDHTKIGTTSGRRAS